MVSQVDAELSSLAEHCSIEKVDSVQGWDAEVWTLSSEAKEILLSVYKKLLVPFDEVYLEELSEWGVPVEALLFQGGEETDQLNRTTRADMTELAAAASLVARESVALPVLVTANVPKRSRRQSEPGIDVMGIVPDLSVESRPFADHDTLVLCSVKHTETDDMTDLRGKLENSIDEMLNIYYLAPQLRVLHGKLNDRGIDAKRVMTLLRKDDLENPERVKVVGVASADVDHRRALERQMQRLANCSPSSRICRNVLITGLATLHEKVRWP
jgi:hypothetical protein